MLIRQTKRLPRDLLKIALLGQGNVYIIPFHRLFFRYLYDLFRVHELCFARFAVFFLDFCELFDDDRLDPQRIPDGVLQLVDFILERFDLSDPFQNVLPIQMTQTDLRDIVRLNRIDNEALHQPRHHIRFLFRFPHDMDRLVDVQQDLAKSPQQMELFLLFFQIKGELPTHTVHTEPNPFL